MKKAHKYAALIPEMTKQEMEELVVPILLLQLVDARATERRNKRFGGVAQGDR